MNPRVFLSYRREDSAAYAGRIEDRLRRALGRNQLFMDVDNVPLGVNFAKLLQDEVAKCDVLLVIIGRNCTRATTPGRVGEVISPKETDGLTDYGLPLRTSRPPPSTTDRRVELP